MRAAKFLTRMSSKTIHLISGVKGLPKVQYSRDMTVSGPALGACFSTRETYSLPPGDSGVVPPWQEDCSDHPDQIWGSLHSWRHRSVAFSVSAYNTMKTQKNYWKVFSKQKQQKPACFGIIISNSNLDFCKTKMSFRKWLKSGFLFTEP